MEIVLGFSIATFIVIVTIDTLQQRRQNMKNMGMKRHEGH
jgi:flagellar biosynthesis protein FlhB